MCYNKVRSPTGLGRRPFQNPYTINLDFTALNRGVFLFVV